MKNRKSAYSCGNCGKPYLVRRKSGYFLKIRGAEFSSDLKSECRLICGHCKAVIPAPMSFHAN